MNGLASAFREAGAAAWGGTDYERLLPAMSPECRRRAALLCPEAAAVLVAAFPYWAGDRPGNLSLYARGKDYHRVVLRRLETVCSYLRRKYPGELFLAGTDSSPLPEREAARFVQKALMSDCVRVYTSYDIVGVELAAALKNVIALSCGICAGLGFQDNTKALLMTRAMAEITRLGEHMGGQRRTFGGLAGMGDLIVTCTSLHSRNNRAGILIGQGKTAQQAIDELGGAVVEGYYAAASAKQLAERAVVEMPITAGAYEVLYQGADPRQVLERLMARERRDELEAEQSWI